MVNNMPTGMKKYSESTEPESCQMAKMFFFISPPPPPPPLLLLLG